MTERDERALRAALGALPPDETLDLAEVRRQAADRRRGSRVVVGIAVALVLLAGVIGVPRLFPGGQAQSTSAGQAGPESGARADSAPTDAAAEGWRTEYYRDISFEVPADWGYAIPPQSDWCADDPRGVPQSEQGQPYVWLEGPIAVRTIGCPAMPPSLLTEHVVALEPVPAEDYLEGSSQVAGWWVVTRFRGSAILIVTTKDLDRAEQILGSSRVVGDDTPCPTNSPVAAPLGTRPTKSSGLAELGDVDQVVLCQYVPDLEAAVGEPHLRAAQQLTGRSADQLVADLQSAPINDTTCNPAPLDGLPELAVLARVQADGQTHDIFIAAAGCPDGDRGMAGGIDDGTTLRLLTRGACGRLLTPPIALYTGSGEVGRNCLG